MDNLDGVIDAFGSTIDVVFDDWTHEWEHQLRSFAFFFPRLASGGVYFVAVRSFSLGLSFCT